MIRIIDNRLEIEIKTLTAQMVQGHIVSLVSKAPGEDFIDGADPLRGSAMELVYAHNDAMEISGGPMAQMKTFALGEDRVELRFHNWNGDGILMVRVDPDNGDL